MWFSSKKDPKKRGIYAVLQGTYRGEFLVYIKQEKNNYNFLTVPGLYILKIPTTVFYNGLENVAIEYVKCMPKKIFNTIESQYNKLNITYELRAAKADNESNKRKINTPEISQIRQR